ncbi:hypothetical protein PIROE2DRAFT_15289 [Piromyces sp. E2]|nr:hypothetical protein PIROE2DRAFT_15289 [Piromyces sp. E2]|eukprot:OUM59224.1 hypothetical protein PIROE2DRAFT_15289 [Piromyces sp. E2]
MKFTSIATVLSTLIVGAAFATNNKTYYDLNKIKEETQWKEVKVVENAPFHLSVISQGYYNNTVNGHYDKNYYYPASAGEGVDVYMFDMGFDFTNKEFEDVEAHIDLAVSHGNVTIPENDKVYYASYIADHGTLTAAVVTGKYCGVAKKANIHGIRLSQGEDEDQFTNIKVTLEYIRDHVPLTSHKTIFNFAYGDYCTIEKFENDTTIREIQNIINELTEKGVIVVSVAGNNGDQAYDVDINKVSVPCVLDNVICVGGVVNYDSPLLAKDEIDPSFYTLGKYDNKLRNVYSNYGRGVDIYASFAAHYRGNILSDYVTTAVFDINPADYDFEKVEDGYYIKNIDKYFPGTSVASPAVVGVAANLISEHPEIKFTHDSMLDLLIELGEKDIIEGIPDGYPNVFLNNGKKIIFDASSMPEVEAPSISSSDEEQEITDIGNDIDSDSDSDSDQE